MTAIMRQVDKLSRLLNQLRDVSRLDGDKLAIDPQPTDVSALLEWAVVDAQALTDRHTFRSTAPASLEAVVDPLRIEQVVINLLDNAVKYSPHGGEIHAEFPDDGGARFVLRLPIRSETELAVAAGR